jgi:hypothetical protein
MWFPLSSSNLGVRGSPQDINSLKYLRKVVDLQFVQLFRMGLWLLNSLHHRPETWSPCFTLLMHLFYPSMSLQHYVFIICTDSLSCADLPIVNPFCYTIVKNHLQQVLVSHAYNPRYPRGKHQEDCDLRLAGANSLRDPISKMPSTKKGWQNGSSGRALA